MFQLVAPTYTYNICVDTKKSKRKVMLFLNDAIQSWVEQNPKLRDRRILTGINILLGDLNQVMPLISKDWHGLISPRSASTASRSHGRSSKPRIGMSLRGWFVQTVSIHVLSFFSS